MSRSKMWKQAVSDAFDALSRMQEIWEDVCDEIDELDNNDKEIPENLQEIADLCVEEAFEMVQIAEDFNPGEDFKSSK